MNMSRMAVASLVGLLCGAVAAVYYLGDIFLPVLIALILAYLLEPLVAPLERRGVNRSLAIFLVFAGFVILLAAVAEFYVSSLRAEFHDVGINLPGYVTHLYDITPPRVKLYLGIETPEKAYQQLYGMLDALRGASAGIAAEALAVVKRAFTSTLAFLLAVLGYFITPVYLFYFLKDLPRLRTRLAELVPERHRPAVSSRLTEVRELLSAFVRGQLSVCAILAVFYSVGLYAIGIDLAIAIGTLAGMAFIIPYLGTVLGIVLAVVMALLKFHDFLHPLLCLGWFGLVQGLEGSVITPKIVGDKVGLHPIVTILALLVGGQLLGILGMLLAVPAAVVLKVAGRSLLAYYRATPFFAGE
jgi:predicted PurR-regulated permease PerM